MRTWNPATRIVVGASIRYGRHRPALVEFIQRNAAVLNRKPSAFFSVNVVARKPGKKPARHQSLRAQAPRQHRVAAARGRRFRRQDRLSALRRRGPHGHPLHHVAHRGPTDPKAVVEFTDWQEVEAFGGLIARM
jgi:menaquinone-dependent protoporphyrinogen oxidase